MAAISKTVLITGARSGIGQATALRLARAGRQVAATGRRPEALSALGAAGWATAPPDVTDFAGMEAAESLTVAAQGPIGVLITNAGYSRSGVMETIPLDKVRAQFEANAFGVLRLTQPALPASRAARIPNRVADIA